MTFSEDNLGSLNNRLNRAFREYKGRLKDCKQRLDADVNKERKKLEDERSRYECISKKYKELSQKAQRGAYIRQGEKLSHNISNGKITATNNP
ncbi:MAG: hypothetical protein RBR71_11500 [Gudongella sp.]|nr:hypothetical protein [Gudongella sp.]